MKSKAIASLELAKKTRASDASYVAEQTVKHFIRDIKEISFIFNTGCEMQEM